VGLVAVGAFFLQRLIFPGLGHKLVFQQVCYQSNHLFFFSRFALGDKQCKSC
jgi:hypothetical protein